MTILCGTDFSEASRQALRAAIAWARREGTGVELVHVVDLHGAFALLARGEGALVPVDQELARWRARAEERVAAEAAAFAGSSVSIVARVLEGAADAALVAHAGRCGARLVVVSAVGARAGSPFTLGSTADRVAQSADRPVLVVRDAAEIEAWCAKRASMRAIVAVDDTSTSDAAVAWSAALARSGGVELTALHVFWPPSLVAKHTGGTMPIGHEHSEAEKALSRALAARIALHAGGQKLPLELVGGLGRTADHVALAAAERRAQLVVVGTHQRGGLARFWHGSVSHGVIDRARTNVVVVPERA
ncbi:MAG: universal stress protein [Planctomycetes bacterium]|nr:universal stress protein [Planctomycetota bacterium]